MEMKVFKLDDAEYASLKKNMIQILRDRVESTLEARLDEECDKMNLRYCLVNDPDERNVDLSWRIILGIGFLRTLILDSRRSKKKKVKKKVENVKIGGVLSKKK